MNAAAPIGAAELALASGFLLVAAALSLALSLGLVRSILVAAARAYVQLLALGLVLRWVFGVATPWLVLAILGAMIAFGTQTLLSRLKSRPPGLLWPSLGSVAVPGVAVTLSVTGLVLRVETWYDPRYVIPIAGMVVGNSMNGVALTLERFFSDLRRRSGEVEALLALGATPWEAALPSARAAFRAGMIPTLNAMSAAGLVFIPGMMTGQVLAGADPGVAASYQIVVLLMLSAATALGAAVAVGGGCRAAFDREERFTLGDADTSAG